MRRFFVTIIPIAALAIFILIMLSGEFLKQPLGNDDNIPKAIQLVMTNVQNEEWKVAKDNTEKLTTQWTKVIKRIQFSSERDEINALSMNIARLRGSIMAKDKSNSLSELSEAYEHWKEIGK